jgi:hypothetical protein
LVFNSGVAQKKRNLTDFTELGLSEEQFEEGIDFLAQHRPEEEVRSDHMRNIYANYFLFLSFLLNPAAVPPLTSPDRTEHCLGCDGLSDLQGSNDQKEHRT